MLNLEAPAPLGVRENPSGGVGENSRRFSDPSVHPFAVARLNRMYYVRFALDHERETARMVSTFSQEARGGTTTYGVHSQIEPFADDYDLDLLPGLWLRLMSAPFNCGTVYRIVSELPR